MIELLLNNTKVIPDVSEKIKITKENPYFTSSDTYTYEISIPMDILENRSFFQNLQRIDHNKVVKSMDAKLMINNLKIVDGTAKITNVTNTTVKIQLLSGNSEINFLSSDNKIYVDELKLGRLNYYGGFAVSPQQYDFFGDITKCVFASVSDETNTKHKNQTTVWSTGNINFSSYTSAIEPNLMYALSLVLKSFGFTLTENDLDVSPWNKIFIASSKCSMEYAAALPHWLSKDFIQEVCNFLNCTIVVNQFDKTCKLKSNISFFETKKTEVVPEDEYETNIDDETDTQSLASSNLKYDLSSSAAHDYDMLSDEIREKVEVKDYNSYAELVTAYTAMSTVEKKKYLFRCPTGKYIWWSDNTDDSSSYLKRVGHFDPVMRDESSTDYKDLKVVPVAISEETVYTIAMTSEKLNLLMPSLENPTGDDIYNKKEDDICIKDYVDGSEEITKESKEDRMQVMFADAKMLQTAIQDSDHSKTYKIPMVFTDCNYKYSSADIDSNHRWSLALTNTDADKYIGQLHANPYKFNMKALSTINFLSTKIPDATSTYVIRNKRYGCQKIEFYIDNNGIQQEMTGYFYEMI